MQLLRSLAATTTLALATIVSIAAFSLLDPGLAPPDSVAVPADAGQHDHAEIDPAEGSGSVDDQHEHHDAAPNDHHDAAPIDERDDAATGDDDHAGHSDDDHAGHGDDADHGDHTSDTAVEGLPPLEGTTESTLARLRAMDPERLASLHDH